MDTPVKDTPAKDVRAALRDLQRERGWSIAETAKRIGASATRISQWLRGEYKGDSARVEALVAAFVATARDVSALRAAGLDRHAALDVTAEIARVAAHAHANRDLVLVYGNAGAGKSWALKHYCDARAGCFYTTMSPATNTPTAVLKRIAHALDATAATGTAAGYEQAVIDRLSAAGEALLVVDESHHLNQALLDVIRCAYDAAGCGLVLAGNDPLYRRLAGGERAAQLVSRVGLTCRLRQPGEPDILELAKTLTGTAVTGAGRAAVLEAGRDMGGLRAVRKLVGQALVLARGDDRDQVTSQDLADAAELLAS